MFGLLCNIPLSLLYLVFVLSLSLSLSDPLSYHLGLSLPCFCISCWSLYRSFESLGVSIPLFCISCSSHSSSLSLPLSLSLSLPPSPSLSLSPYSLPPSSLPPSFSHPLSLPLSLGDQKHERQAQQHFQQQLRRRREEEELQRQAELQAEARQEADHQHQHHHDKAQGGGGKAGDKPKRPSSLLGNNNVMKLKQIIPLQGKFSSGASRSPAQSPTGGEAKLPGFLNNFKFLKSSPEGKKDGPAGGAAGTPPAAPAGQERPQSPNRTFSPGKLFSFSKSEGTVVCANGTQPPRAGEASGTQPSRAELNSASLDELPSNDSQDKGDTRQHSDAFENNASRS